MRAVKHIPTKETRTQATAYAAVGVPYKDIALLLKISEKKLKRYYTEELGTGRAQANSTVARRLFTLTEKGNLGAMCFWLKCQAGWREVDQRQMLGKDGKPIDPPAAVQVIANGVDLKL